MCTEDEISAMTEFLDEERASAEIVQLITLNMTKDEQDFSLPHDQYEMLRRSCNKVLNKIVNSNLKENVDQFLNTLTPNDNNKLRAYGMLSEEDKLVAFIDEKITEMNFTGIDKSEIEKYLKDLFMSLKLD
ncbi:unnamed protein product [Cercopithifilaria johnstoni]|uniref:Uncharacterized protein n=1 Tax=Cercopithifilaria johnstoni TaxID=2874296 RepID=A0A8J2MK51_9BILA|nr:unnamed protein product [Cercopithifilaria johnstoni]